MNGSPGRAMKHLSVAGADLAYEVKGTGHPTLAFVHGWLSHATHWDAQATHFAADHRVVRWDRRGMGQSAGASPADSARRHADDLAAILDHEEIETFAASYPDRAEGLVMVDSRVHAPPDDGESDPFAATVNGIIAGLEGEGGREFLAPVYASFFGPLAPPAVVEAAVVGAQEIDTAVAVGELRHVLDDTASVAARVRCPVLSISADPTDTGTVRSTFTDVEVGHVVGAGHFLHLEVPDQFNAMVVTFLARL